MKKNGRLIIGAAAGVIIISLFVVSIITFIYRADIGTGTTIADEVKMVSAIFDRINKKCVILGFDEQQNVINFLTVQKFLGAEVGSMNLAYPEKWEGPYLDKNPEIQGKEYIVVRTKQGFFITPGNGVKLPSGSVIGKDLILDENADIQGMITKGKLSFRGRSLATKINIQDMSLVAEVAELEE
jgi:hypothetical protein